MLSRRNWEPHRTNTRSDWDRKPLIVEYLKDVSFEEAFNEAWIRKKALQANDSTVPEDFRQFVLRQYAVCERGCRHFEAKLNYDVRNYLKSLVGLQPTDIQVNPVHPKCSVKPNGFLGVVVRYFFRKLIFNIRNEPGRYEYAENYACIFPFRVSSSIPTYDIDVLKLLDNDFYDNTQTFFKKHFVEEPFLQARAICYLFLANIRHFQATKFPQEALLERLKNVLYDLSPDRDKIPDYLDTFPRLNNSGVKWFAGHYAQFRLIRKIYYNVDEPIFKYDDNYFRSLPELNFVELYSLLDGQFYTSRRCEYTTLFERYLFFFVHALHNDSHPIFFIDEVLFQCLKCVHHFKTSRDDIGLVNDMAMLSLVHLRTKREIEDPNRRTDHQVQIEDLQNIKKYTLNFPDIQNARIDVDFKSDFLHGWMLLRTKDTCFDMCYSVIERKQVNHFLDRILCSVLCPDDERIKYVVLYNAYMGQETKIVMPTDTEKVRNFVRISNTYDFSQETPEDEFLTRDLEDYFENLPDTH